MADTPVSVPPVPPVAHETPRPHRGRGGPRQDQHQSPYIEKLISVNRVAKVHKGGKRLSFCALVVVGDGKGRVGLALSKAHEAADAIRKGMAKAQHDMVMIQLKEGTIPYGITGRYDASKVLLQPAAPGTGILAGGVVRAVCEAAGIRNILTKSLGSSNSVNLAKATLNGLLAIENPQAIRSRREMTVDVREGEETKRRPMTW